jgi:hypothetical protein
MCVSAQNYFGMQNANTLAGEIIIAAQNVAMFDICHPQCM